MTKTIIRFFTIADYEEEEAWLQAQQKKGLRLVKLLPPCFFTFEIGEPKDVVYRLDYKNTSISPDYLQLARDYGWEYVGDTFGWLYFRKDASEIHWENDGEIFSDPQSRVEMLRHILHTRLVPVGLIFLLCVIPNWIRAIYHTMEFWDLLFLGSMTGIVALYLYLLVHCSRKLAFLHKKYHIS